MPHSATPRCTQLQRRETTRNALIQAVFTVIKDEGYAAASTRRIAAVAGSSLGAMNYHFSTRHELIAEAFDEIFGRATAEFQESVRQLEAEGEGGIGAILDSLWALWRTDIFAVWAHLWVAATGDPELYDVLTPVESRLTKSIGTHLATFAPAGIDPKIWIRRSSLAVDAMRGLAFIQHFEPTGGTRRRDRWPDTRAELIELLNRPN
ncbi:TetR/AcrR family transcriptional regulator [Nocardia sp. NPDC051756]|uniref:TetR/AcrR family transcriptional regulator n=1 Tax=Nocardia sp. NPDC051756 TaxID=3154751 RepID=UPI00341AC217